MSEYIKRYEERYIQSSVSSEIRLHSQRGSPHNIPGPLLVDCKDLTHANLDTGV